MPPDRRSDAQCAALALSDALIDELDAADFVLLSTPMHNFMVPSVLKAWLDHVVRPRRTFGLTATGKIGWLRDRPVRVLLACGGAVGEEPAGQADFATPRTGGKFPAQTCPPAAWRHTGFMEAKASLRGRRGEPCCHQDHGGMHRSTLFRNLDVGQVRLHWYRLQKGRRRAPHRLRLLTVPRMRPLCHSQLWLALGRTACRRRTLGVLEPDQPNKQRAVLHQV